MGEVADTARVDGDRKGVGEKGSRISLWVREWRMEKGIVMRRIKRSIIWLLLLGAIGVVVLGPDRQREDEQPKKK